MRAGGGCGLPLAVLSHQRRHGVRGVLKAANDENTCGLGQAERRRHHTIGMIEDEPAERHGHWNNQSTNQPTNQRRCIKFTSRLKSMHQFCRLVYFGENTLVTSRTKATGQRRPGHN